MLNIALLRDTALASYRGEDPVRYLMLHGKMSHEVAHYEISSIICKKNDIMTYEEMVEALKYDEIGKAINSYLNDITIEQADESYDG